MTQQTKSRGFTIVELLIVIVIIAILAAITIVAYTGITKKANSSAAAANAGGVMRVSEAYAADADPGGGNGTYPTLAQINAYSGISRVPAGVNLIPTTLSATQKDGKTIQYLTVTGNTGACIGYWDDNSGTAKYVYSGAAKTGTNAAIPTCV